MSARRFSHVRPASAPAALTDAEILEVSDGCWDCGDRQPVVVVNGLPLCARCDHADAPVDACETTASFPSVRDALRVA